MKKTISAVITGALIAGALASCSGSAQPKTVTMNGSTSMQKLVEAACEVFNQENPGITASAQFTGSGAGIEAVSAGTADIGNASRALKQEEKDKGLVENIVAIDGIAVIANSNCTIDNLTKEQLTQIYDGTIADWSGVGAQAGQIVVIGRESGSGTRDAFEEMLDIADKCKYAQELDSTGAVLTTVASTPNAIGYVSLDVLNDSVVTLKVDGYEPTAQNITAGKYALQRPFVMATKGEISEQSEAVQTWFEFLKSDKGKEIAESVGLIPVE
ncbi:MAG: phosphate ABC transporter substrate-binding protein [Clostridiales bacterium]|nr:phosphate ABC transporter substrate-binding protein [Clostridiales bacterium]